MPLFRKKTIKLLHTSPSACSFLSTLPGEQESDECRERTRDFVKHHIKQRECNRFIPAAEESAASGKPDVCGCGRTLHEHLASVPGSEPDSQPMGGTNEWSPEVHTKLTECNSYGEILFSGFGNEVTCAPYARVDDQTSPEILFSLLTDVWKLKPPKLVVSVTGGSKEFFLKQRIKKALQKGFIDITQSTDTWLITGGTAAGVMQYVGQSVREYAFTGAAQIEHEMTAIGIASWGIVEGTESLVGPKHLGQFPAVYDPQSCTDPAKVPLDSNHTHFLLVDNGSTGQYGVAITARAKLEEFLSRQTHETMTSSEPVPTPVVLLVVEGSLNTIEQTRASIVNGIPVVIVDQSGRASDVMTAAYRMTFPKQVGVDTSNFPPRFDRLMKKMIEDTFSVNGNSSHGSRTVNRALKSLRQILEKRYLVTLFAVDESDTMHMDKAILTALLKSKNFSLGTQVELSLIWNRSDLARDIIFVPENRSRFKELNLEKALITALLRNEVEFVELILEHGVHLKEFLTKHRLYDLYSAALDDTTSGLGISIVVKNMIVSYTQFFCFSYSTAKLKKLNTEDEQLYRVGILIEKILNEEVEHIYPGEHEHDDESDESTIKDIEKKYFHYPARDLFLWAVIFQRKDIAHLLWNKIINPIGGALIASLLLRSLAKRAKKQEEIELSVDLEKESKEYEKMAVGVLQECNTMSKSATHDILARNIEGWGNASLICLAGNNGQRMEFMGHGACQSKISRIWKGKMSELTDDWKVFITAVCPILLPFMIKFKSSDVLPTSSLHPIQPLSDQSPVGQLRSSVTKMSKSDVSHDSQGKTCRVGLRTTNQTLGFISGYYNFYTAPVTKFTMHALSHLIFLGLFTCIVLTELKPVGNFDNLVSLLEIVVWVWAGTLFLDEFRQLFSTAHRSFSVKFYVYFSSSANILDLALSILLIITIGIRSGISQADQTTARVTYSILLMFWYLRFMSYFFLWKSIGPKIFMIRKMLKDLMFFICILLIFILSFGFPMQALLHPNRPFSMQVVMEALYSPYFNMFGELLLDRVEGNSDSAGCSNNLTLLALDPSIRSCPVKTWIVPLMFAIYIMLTNVLLLNLLIAMFSYTFQMVQENSERVWQYHRYGLVHDTYNRPALPPPLIILSHIYRLANYIWRKITGVKRTSYNAFSYDVPESMNAKLNVLERIARDNYMMEQRKQRFHSTEQQLSMAINKIDIVSQEVEKQSEFINSRRFVRKWLNHIQAIAKNGGPTLFNTGVSAVVGDFEQNINDGDLEE